MDIETTLGVAHLYTQLKKSVIVFFLLCVLWAQGCSVSPHPPGFESSTHEKKQSIERVPDDPSVESSSDLSDDASFQDEPPESSMDAGEGLLPENDAGGEELQEREVLDGADERWSETTYSEERNSEPRTEEFGQEEPIVEESIPEPECQAGETKPCFTGPSHALNKGACRSGLVTCSSDGTWGTVCAGEVVPRTETCDGTDDDCDGDVDESFAKRGQRCQTSQLGACKAGHWSCLAGKEVCDTPKPIPELCNGVDDDCDGQTDEDFPQKGDGCYSGMMGVCTPGSYTCSSGKVWCTPIKQPTAEICNGLDDNCNGQTDEAFPENGKTCTVQGTFGVCAPGTYHCISGVLSCHSVNPPQAETCNGKDDDCDGQTDESDPQMGQHCAPPGLPGRCLQWKILCSSGVLKCTQVSTQTNIPEVCNGLDDDCDGQTDETFAGVGQACSISGQLGPCATGVKVCLLGKEQCQTKHVKLPVERCHNQIDDDCNGKIDDNCSTGPSCLTSWKDPIRSLVTVREIVYSPDGKKLALISPSSVDVFDIATKKVTHQFRFEQANRSIAFRKDNSILYTTGLSKNYAWSLRTSSLLFTFEAGKWMLTADEKTLIVARNQEILRFDASNGQLKSKLSLSQSFPINESTAFTDDGKMLVNVGYSFILRLDTTTGKRLNDLYHQRPFLCYSGRFSRDGSLHGCWERSFSKVNVLDVKKTNFVSVQGGFSLTSFFAFSDDNQYMYIQWWRGGIGVSSLGAAPSKPSLKTNSEIYAVRPDNLELSAIKESFIEFWNAPNASRKQVFPMERNFSVGKYNERAMLLSDGKSFFFSGANSTYSYGVWNGVTKQFSHFEPGLPFSSRPSENIEQVATGGPYVYIRSLKDTGTSRTPVIRQYTYSPWKLIRTISPNNGANNLYADKGSLFIHGLQQLHVYDAATGQKTKTYNQINYANSSSKPDLTIGPNGKYIATFDSNSIKLLDRVTGQFARQINHKVGSVVFSHDGKTIYGNSGTRLYAWRVSDGVLLKTVNLDIVVDKLFIHKDEKFLLGRGQSKILLCELPSLKVKYASLRNTAGFSKDHKSIVLTWPSYGHVPLSSKVMDISAFSAMQFSPKTVKLSPDGRYLFALNPPYVQLLRVDTFQVLKSFSWLYDVRDVSFDTSGLYAVVVTQRTVSTSPTVVDSTVHIWDLQSHQIERSILVKGKQIKETYPNIQKGRILLQEERGGIHFLDVYTGSTTDSGYRCHESVDVLFRKGRVVESCNGTLMVWDVQTQKVIVREKVAISASEGVKAHPLTGWASYHYSGEIRIFDESTKKHTTIVKAPAGESFATFAWSSDGKRLVTSTKSGLLRVWDPSTGKQLADYPLMETGTIKTLQFLEGSYSLLVSQEPGQVHILHCIP
tara:strand:+ start:2611 stop:6753 length:4143 start_codon:yes stop_codon:yes gene_type:complete